MDLITENVDRQQASANQKVTPYIADSSRGVVLTREDMLRRGNEAFNTPAIESPALKAIGQHASFLGLDVEGVCDLHLAITPRGQIAQDIEDIGGQNIPTDHGQVGWRL